MDQLISKLILVFENNWLKMLLFASYSRFHEFDGYDRQVQNCDSRKMLTSLQSLEVCLRAS